MTLLTKLYERPGLSAYELPDRLERLHDGRLGFGPSALVANFVSSIDGVVALRAVPASPSVISGRSEADRLMMGLLRACAGTVLIGASTLRAEPEHQWTPEHIYPDAVRDFAELRGRLGLPPQPQLAVLTQSGAIDTRTSALRGAMILTGAAGRRRLEAYVSPDTEIIELAGEGRVSVAAAIETLRSQSDATVLSEGGPSLMSQLARERLIDELFLTLSPQLIGRTSQGGRPGLADGNDLLQPSPLWSDLLSVRRSESHLLLRYGFPRQAEDGASSR